jgi:ubiquinone/menaquinone biosynthesis C-methylase UbiE
MPNLDSTIREFYESGEEAGRLDRGLPQLEFERTRELVASTACRVADIGGGSGRYAVWLSELGHRVRLIDPVLSLLQAAPSGALEASIVAEARALPLASESADIVLLFGPLYHLQERQARIEALSEANRVLPEGGVLLTAAITRWAYLIYGLVQGLHADSAFATIVEETVRTGRHFNPQGRRYFTTAYFHHPEELRAELADTGFEVERVYGVEGPAAVLRDFDERWSRADTRAELVRAAELVEQEHSLLGLSPHILAVGRKSHGAGALA